MDTPSGSTTAAPAAPSTPSSAPTPAASTGNAGTPAGKSAPTPQAGNSKFATGDAGAAPDAGAPTAGERRARMLKLKVDGKELDYDVDNATDEKLALDLQMAQAARKRMQETAEIKKQFAAFVEHFKKDPWAVAKDPLFGVDLEKLAEQRLAQKYQEQLMPDHERAVLQAQREAQDYKSQLEAIHQEREAVVQREMDAKVEAETKRDFKLALEKSALPANDLTLGMMAQVASEALSEGLELTPQQMATEAQERMSAMSQQVFGRLKGEALHAYLGDAVVKEVLRTAVAKVQAQGKAPAPSTAAPTEDGKPGKQLESPGRKFWRTY